jgi:hypothetical protein
MICSWCKERQAEWDNLCQECWEAYCDALWWASCGGTYETQEYKELLVVWAQGM